VLGAGRSGAGELLLMRGPAGIGKTSLLGEARRAAAPDMLVLRGVHRLRARPGPQRARPTATSSNCWRHEPKRGHRAAPPPAHRFVVCGRVQARRVQAMPEMAARR
jgi:hypothetical protein